MKDTKVTSATLEELDKAADAELEALRLQTEGKGPETTAPTPPAGEPPKGEEPKPGDTPPAAAAGTPGTGLPTPQGATPPAPAAAPAGTPEGIDYKAEYERLKPIAEEAEKWKERYAAINGKYMSEVPRYSTLINQLKAQVDSLKGFEGQLTAKDQEIQTLNTKLTDALSKVGSTTAPGTTTPDAIDEAIEKFRAEHGDKFADTLASMMKPMKDTIETLKGQLTEAKKSTVPPAAPAPGSTEATPGAPAAAPETEEKFWTALTMAVPNFMEINNDPRFLQFLGTTEPSSGLSYETLLHLHHKNWNVGGNGTDFGVADVFKRFGTSPAAAAVAPGAAPAGTPPAGTGTFKGVDEHVDPSTVGGGKETAPVTKKTYSMSKEINPFVRDIQAGRAQKNMTQAEIEATLAEHDMAIAEGRVTD